MATVPDGVGAIGDGNATEARATPGRELFRHYCASCHGWEGRGDGPVAPHLSKAPADLTQIASRRAGLFPDQEIGEIIDGRRVVGAHGTRQMPVWGRLFGRGLPPVSREVEIDNQLRLLLDYLRSIQVVVEPPRSGEPG